MQRGRKLKSVWMRIALLVMVMLVVGSAWTIHIAWEQDANDAGLIAAINRNDSDAVRLYFARGASPDAHEHLAMNGSLLSRIKAFLLRQEVPRRDAEAICEHEIIACKVVDGPPRDPKILRNQITIYELIIQAKCRKHPGTCGPAVK
jgi:hypothetical protein